jgi:predicted dehydrogenase
MGRAYADVLRALGIAATAVGRSKSGTEEFARTTGMTAIAGGIEAWRQRGESAAAAIVCVSLEESAAVLRALLAAGVRRILVEKPGATTPAELADLALAVAQARAQVLLAYNRRFYASVLEAQRRAAAEGGVISFHFEFTERERDATSGKFGRVAQAHWALANSSHVIDLAFHLGGEPESLQANIADALDWHPAGAIYTGSGMSRSGAAFSYCANWLSAGRWGVELMTRESRLILKPLEQLQVQKRGSFAVENVELDLAHERDLKPGLFRQVAAFMAADDSRFITLADQASRAAGWLAGITGEK